MSTADASKSAGATGIELRFDGDDFALSAAAAPHAAVLDALSQHKTGIVALLRQAATDGRPRIGRRTLTSGRELPSSPVDYRVRRPRRTPSSAALWSG